MGKGYAFIPTLKGWGLPAAPSPLRKFKARGHDAWSCDLLPTEILGQHYQGDIRDIFKDFSIIGGKPRILIAHPECTYLTVSGNKWMKSEYKERFPNRQQQRIEAQNFFMEMINANIEYIAVENPIGVMSTQYRKPDQIIQPWQFGHPETKATCLWLEGLPKLIPSNIVTPEWIIGKTDGKRYSPTHYMTAKSYGKDINRQKERSRTYPGIAQAMAEQWG